MITAKSTIAKNGNGRANKKHTAVSNAVITAVEIKYPKTDNKKMGMASAVSLRSGNLKADSKSKVGRKTKKMSSGDNWNSERNESDGSFWITKERIIPTNTKKTE